MPLNGYVRFLNANRERIKNENSHLSFAEVTKKLASQWSSMEMKEKKVYLDEANKEKEEYLIELQKYKQTEQYQTFMRLKRAKQQQQQQQLGASGSSMLEGRTSSNSSMISGSMIQFANQQQSMQVYEPHRGGSNHRQYYNDNTYAANTGNTQQQYTGYNNMAAAGKQQHLYGSSSGQPSTFSRSYDHFEPNYQASSNLNEQVTNGQKGVNNQQPQRSGVRICQSAKGTSKVYENNVTAHESNGPRKVFNYESDSNDAKTSDSSEFSKMLCFLIC